MKLKHNFLEIPENDPFQNCKLGRKVYAEVLSSIISNYSDGFVMSLNNPWGTGKTTFVKMLEQYLKSESNRTLYFNAWENDFDENPMVAIMSEIKTLTKADDSTFKSLLSKGAVLMKNVAPAIIKATAEKYISTDVFVDAMENIGKSAFDILSSEIDEFAKRKKGLVEFRDELERFLQKQNNGKPVVFIIDELDRCRPNYAVEVLEQIKHFFSVPGIVFILSIDKLQLSNAIRGVYNSDRIDAAEYLRRFIDLEYSLPTPDTSVYTAYLYKYFEFAIIFDRVERKQHSETREDGESFLSFSTTLLRASNATLRQQEKIYAHARLALNSFGTTNYIFPTLYFFLAYVRDFYPDFYNILKARQVPPQDIIDKLKECIPSRLVERDLRTFRYLEALLVVFYNNYHTEINNYRSKVYEQDKSTMEYKSLVQSCLPIRENDYTLADFFKDIARQRYSDIKLDYLTNIIDLTKAINI